MKRVFLTGANRGLGLEFARQCLARGDRVFASCRQPQRADELQGLKDAHPGRLTVLKLDVTRADEIEAAGEAMEAETDGLELLVNNAAVYPRGERPGALEAVTILGALHTNAVAPLLVSQRLLGLLRAGERPRVANISSRMGSLSGKRSGGNYSYCGSKAALNMFTRALAIDLLPHGVVAVALSPGWAQTDMGGSGAPLTTQRSVQGMLRVIDGLGRDDAGRFLQWDGAALPW